MAHGRGGRQTVSADWIKQMTTRHSPHGMWFGFAHGYGYLWWLGRSSIGRRDIDWVGSLGWGGQRQLSLVVAVIAGAYGGSQGGAPSAQENLAGDTALNSFVLPAALGDVPQSCHR
jgi:CubicO group peptidase (beta-lactamase class C family)